MCQAGILTIKHIFNSNANRFISHRDLAQKYHINTTIIQYSEIVHAIPIKWRSVLKNAALAESPNFPPVINLSSLTEKNHQVTL